ncbi:MAG: hypothetical protein GY941_22435 [Planctomycetes bacterium]|nr:hypothetical protein [Planctomycetota bacterium]
MKLRKVKKQNRARHKAIMAELPLTIVEENYGSTYFIFRRAYDSICHFKAKGHHGWLFGIWLNEKDNGYALFWEHEEYIDKFKPAACVCVNDTKDFAQEFDLKRHELLAEIKEWEEWK